MTEQPALWHSLLFVPGDRPELVTKAIAAGPDVVVLDLEDAVAPAAKAEARRLVVEAAASWPARGGPRLFIRVNAPGSDWFDADLAAVGTSGDGVVVPKWEVPLEIGRPIIAGLETVRGVVDARQSLTNGVVACYVGAEDYIADLGGVRTASNDEVAHARSAVSVAARLAGVPALDMVTVDFRDDDRFRREAASARSLGFRGKMCIHPRQVALAHDAFRPTDHEVDRARRLLDAYDAAGGGTISFEGQMVDEVIAVQARAVLATARSTVGRH